MGTHWSLVESSSEQAGLDRVLTASPVGLKSSFRIVKHYLESTAACWVNDTENMHVQPTYQIVLPAGGDARCSTFVQVPLRRIHVDLKTSAGTIRPGGLGR